MSTTSLRDQLQPKIDANRSRLDDLLSQLLTQPAYTWQNVKDHKVLSLAQKRYGVYHFLHMDQEEGITSIYVGESHTLSRDADLAIRARAHFLSGHPGMGNLPGNLVRAGHQNNHAAAADFVKEHYHLQYLVLSTPVEALELEHHAIAALLPRYNFIIGSQAQLPATRVL
ncbi:hypothetical protein ACN28S_56850 [Cystobacter fuscus]